MKNLIALIIFGSFSCLSYTQNSLTTNHLVQQYDQNTIYLKKKGFEKAGQRIPYGTFKKNLKKELTAFPMALQEYKRSRKNLWVAIGSSVVSAAFVFSSARSDNYRKELNYTGLSFNLLSIPFKIKSQNQLNRAVWLYNREAIVQKKL